MIKILKEVAYYSMNHDKFIALVDLLEEFFDNEGFGDDRHQSNYEDVLSRDAYYVVLYGRGTNTTFGINFRKGGIFYAGIWYYDEHHSRQYKEYASNNLEDVLEYINSSNNPPVFRTSKIIRVSDKAEEIIGSPIIPDEDQDKFYEECKSVITKLKNLINIDYNFNTRNEIIKQRKLKEISEDLYQLRLTPAVAIEPHKEKSLKESEYRSWIKKNDDSGWGSEFWSDNTFIKYLLQSEDNFIKLDKGNLIYMHLPVTTKYFDLSDDMIKQFKEEGVYGNYTGVTIRSSSYPELPMSPEKLPIYGRSDKYVTGWLADPSHRRESIKHDIKDRDLVNRANDYLMHNGKE